MPNPGTEVMNGEARLDHPRRCHGQKAERHWADPQVPEQCLQYALIGSNYCKFHGGHQSRSVALRKNFKAHSTFLTGLPKKLARRIAAAAEDPELTSLRGHIALLDDRILQLAAKLPTKESAQAWRSLQEDFGELEAQLALLKRCIPPELSAANEALVDSITRTDKILASMRKDFRRTHAERELWTEILGHNESRRRMAETEAKRENMLQANLTARQTITLFAALNAILQEELSGLPEVKRRVGARLSTLIMNEPRAVVRAKEEIVEDAEVEILPPDGVAGASASEATDAGERQPGS